MSTVNEMLIEEFICPKCEGRNAIIERLAMTGTGVSRIFRIPYREYIVVSCADCGRAEVYNLRVLKEISRRRRG